VALDEPRLRLLEVLNPGPAEHILRFRHWIRYEINEIRYERSSDTRFYLLR
jgi:hypothetical protein